MRNLPPGPAGATITVDFHALRRLAQTMHELSGRLAGPGEIASAELDSDLLGRLKSVDGDWSAHRRQLQSFLSDTAAAVEQIVAQYEKTDDMIASAATR